MPIYKTEEINFDHGNPQRFLSKVFVNSNQLGEDWGKSIREAEQKAARKAIKKSIKKTP